MPHHTALISPLPPCFSLLIYFTGCVFKHKYLKQQSDLFSCLPAAHPFQRLQKRRMQEPADTDFPAWSSSCGAAKADLSGGCCPQPLGSPVAPSVGRCCWERLGVQGGGWHNPTPKATRSWARPYISRLSSALSVSKRREGVVGGAGERCGSGGPGMD